MYFNRLKVGRKRSIKKKKERSSERHGRGRGRLAVHCWEGYRVIPARPSDGGKLVWDCEEGTVMGSGLLTRKQRTAPCRNSGAVHTEDIT